LIASDTQQNERILVDTDVVSYLFGDRPQANYFKPFLSGKTLAVSFMTIAQLYYGAYKKNWGETQILKLERHLKNYVVLPYDFKVCLEWG
jgi:predicted nucleic acid-binding protein